MKRVNDVLACETFMKKARPVDMPIESNRMPRMVGCLSAIVAAALSACGGANDGESAAMDSVVSARVSAFANSGADGVPDVQLAAAKNAGKGNSGANWAKVADENASFLVGTAQTVRFGVGNKWTTKVVSGKGDCNIAFFGSDPASGSLKECQVSETSGTPLDDSAVAPAPTNSSRFVMGSSVRTGAREEILADSGDAGCRYSPAARRSRARGASRGADQGLRTRTGAFARKARMSSRACE